MTATTEEIVLLLSAHAGEPMDYVAIVTLLNTVAGGHYEDRHSEAAIRAGLLALLQSGRVRIATAPDTPAPAPELAAAGHCSCTFRLADPR